MGKSILDLPKQEETVGYHVVINGTASSSMVLRRLEAGLGQVWENLNKCNEQFSLLPTFVQQATSVLLPAPLSRTGTVAARDDYFRKCLITTWPLLSPVLFGSVVWHEALNC